MGHAFSVVYKKAIAKLEITLILFHVIVLQFCVSHLSLQFILS